jgi:trans-aconitate 2-methyltransferase
VTRDWDAATYHRVSGIQERWARAVLERLPLRGDETVLDAGCGSGRVTAMLAERLPDGQVIGVDGSPSMIEEARRTLPPGTRLMTCDLLDLDLEGEVDAVFSNAVFHWVPDHPRLFTRLYAALRPGGSLVAQCGGEGNVRRFNLAVDAVLAREPFRRHFEGWRRPWRFASDRETEGILRQAGFGDVSCWLEPSPEVPDAPSEFLRTVCLGPHLERLPPELHDGLVDAVHEQLPDPVTIDYVRLNIDARRPRE